jgi:hypothetical protein
VTRTLALGASALLFAACSHDSAPQTTPVIPGNCTLPSPAASTLPAAQVIELGVHSVGDKVAFTVPAGTGSITIVHQAVGAVPLQVVFNENGTAHVADNSAVPRLVSFPDGGTAYDDFAFPAAGADGTTDPSGTYISYSQDTPVAAAFTFPNTATSLAQGVPPGPWSFVVGDFAYECATGISCFDGGTTQDRYDVKVLLRPLPTGAALDMNFYLVGASTTRAGVPLTAATAPSDPSTRRMITTLQSIYAGANITVREPRFFDVTAAQRAAYAHIVVNGDSGEGPCDQLDQMFLLSSANPGPAMNVFLVSDIVDSSATGTNTLVGIDGTIPGPTGLAGTVHSGAAVSLAELFSQGAAPPGAPTSVCSGPTDFNGCGADRVAYIAAHETGHFLGLFHTSESGGTLVDPLTDTGACTCSACATPAQKPNCGKTGSSAPSLDATQCVNAGSTCGGGDNLMFWQFETGTSQGTLSSQQSQVMRLNPLIQ